VVAAKRDVEYLKELIEKDKAEAAKGDDSAGTRKATVPNPVYEQVKLRLVDANGVVAAAQRQLDFATAEQKRLEDSIKSVPGIELQAQNLDRDYDVLKRNYTELISRREAASMAQAADTQADKVQFRIVDAPQVPLLPVSPNRPILYTAVLVAGLGAGVGAAFLLVQLDRSFSTLSALRNFGFPVLGSISRVNIFGTRRRAVQQATGLAASMFALLMIYGALLLANYNTIHKVV
jgi:uncharacterized protein involved in exopolysaccharide biosynthesis